MTCLGSSHSFMHMFTERMLCYCSSKKQADNTWNISYQWSLVKARTSLESSNIYSMFAFIIVNHTLDPSFDFFPFVPLHLSYHIISCSVLVFQVLG